MFSVAGASKEATFIWEPVTQENDAVRSNTQKLLFGKHEVINIADEGNESI